MTCQDQFFCLDPQTPIPVACDLRKVLGNGECEELYASEECGWDMGDCGFCALGCFEADLSNGVCESECASKACEFDGGDCVTHRQGWCALGCFAHMLGNGECEEECLNKDCEYDGGDCASEQCSAGCFPSMLGDGSCQEACHLPACQWDMFDCDCSPGCTPAKLSNSLCDPECAVGPCQFDQYFCVIFIQGHCSAGCFRSMIGDERCDPDCNVEECEWDGLDCGCAPGCAFEEIEQCKVECLVADCNYGEMPGYPVCEDIQLRTATKYYHIIQSIDLHYYPNIPYNHTLCLSCSPTQWLLSFSQCLPSGCNSEGCLYNFGHCFTFPSCLAGYTSFYPKFGNYCLRCEEQYVNVEGTCKLVCDDGLVQHKFVRDICVLEQDETSEESPELLYVSAEYQGDDANGSFERPFSTIREAFVWVRKRFTKVLLIGSEHRLTGNSSSFLLADPSDILPLRSYRDRQVSVALASYECELQQPCAVPVIWLASPVTFNAPGWINTRERCWGSIEQGILYVSNVEFRGYGGEGNVHAALFDIGSNRASFVNVSFTELPGLMSVIYMDHSSSLHLSSVSFTRILAYDALIYQQNRDNTYCFQFLYTDFPVNITIENTNVDGLLDTNATYPHAVLSAYAINHLLVRNMMVRNIISSQGQSAVFLLNAGYSMKISDCLFQTNRLLYGSIVMLRSHNWDILLDELHNYKPLSQTNLEIVNCTFRGNKLGKPEVRLLFERLTANVKLLGLRFEHEEVRGSAVEVESVNPVNKTRVLGLTRYIANAAGVLMRTSFPPSYLDIAGLSMQNCTFRAAVVSIFQMTYVSVDNMTLENVSSVTLFSLLSSYGLSFSSLDLRGLSLSEDSYVLLVRKASGPISISKVAVRNCSVLHSSGGFLTIESNDEVNITDIQFENNTYAFGRGLVHFSGTAARIAIQRAVFYNNQSPSCLSCVSVSQLAVSNSIFIANIAGALHFSIDDSVISQLQIHNSTLKENQGQTKGGVTIDSTGQWAKLYVKITNSTFERCRNEAAGAIFVAGRIELLTDSKISNTVIRENEGSPEGSISLHYSLGSLTVENVLFQGNKGLHSAAIFVAFSPDDGYTASIDMRSVRFEENSGESIIEFPDAPIASLFIGFNITFEANSGTCFFSESADIRLSTCSFDSNSHLSSPVFSLKSSTLLCTDTLFLANRAHETSGVGLVAYLARFNCSECVFENNTAGMQAGVISVVQTGQVSLQQCSFRGNIAGVEGAILYLLMTTQESSVIDSEFVENEARGDGVILLFSSVLSLTNVTFRRNRSLQLGAGLVLTLSNLTLSSCRFEDQVGKQGIFIHSDTFSHIRVRNCLFQRGRSSGIGALYIVASTLYLLDSEFLDMTAALGAAVYASNHATIYIHNVSLIHLISPNSGVIHCELSSCTLSSLTIANYSASAITALEATLVLQDSDVKEGMGEQGVGLYSARAEHLLVMRTKFARLKGQSGVAIWAEGGLERLEVADCLFDGIRGRLSGAIHIYKASMQITKSVFTNNSAAALALIGEGGAITFQCGKAGAVCNSTVLDCFFLYNSAGLRGGAISWHDQAPSLFSNTFLNNSAPYGPSLASSPIRLLTLNTSLVGVPSGQPYQDTLQFWLIDQYNQTVVIDNETQAELRCSDPRARVYGSTLVSAVNGEFHFSDFSIIAPPESNITVQVDILGGSFPLTLKVSMRSCLVGESETEGRCVACAPGTFSLSSSEPCRDCLAEALCYGNFTMCPRPGYWRADYLHTRFFVCPNEEACLGPPALTGECKEGHMGNKCQTCASNYYRVNKNVCKPCGSLTARIAQTSGILLAVCFFLAFLIKMAIKSAHTHAAYHSIYLKLLVNYLQLIMWIGAVNLRWPKMAKWVLDAQSEVGGVSEEVLSIACLREPSDETNDFYFKVVLMSCAPLIFCGAVCLPWVLLAICKQSFSSLNKEMISSAVIVFFLIHPNVVQVVLSVVNCEEILPGEYWVTGLMLRCWQGTHWKYVLALMIPAMITWGIAVPGIVLIVLMINRKHLRQLRNKIRFGYLFNGYRNEKYYWEFIVIFRKLLIMTSCLFVPRLSEELTALFLLAALSLFCLLQSAHQPYSTPTLNVLESRLLLAVLLSVLCGLFFHDPVISPLTQYILICLFLLANGNFLQYWLRKACRSWIVFVVTKVHCCAKYFYAVDELTVARRNQHGRALLVRSSALSLWKRELLLARLHEQYSR